MFKRVLISSLIALAVTIGLFYAHTAILSSSEIEVSFSIFKSYVFHFVFFILAVLVIEVIFMLSPAQLGFSYLGVILVKFGAFIVIFKTVLFEQDSILMETRLSLVLPLLLYILPEALYCARILRKVDVHS